MFTAIFAAIVVLYLTTTTADARQYSAFVMDARNGEVLHSRNADTRLHPASLTKMMTLYLVFEAVEAGRLRLDQKFTISKRAAAQPPSKIGWRRGQKVSLRTLIRAAAVKSANDSATALAEAVSGSEWKFAQAMTAKARSLGMSRTTFKNASGLTAKGHLSTARDMATLGRRLFYDFPDYYNLFSRNSVQINGRTFLATNRRFVKGYKGADGIKTGYTRAAGFTLVGSAERGDVRIVASVFGGRTGRTRDKEMMRLLDLGFNRAKRHAQPVIVLKSPAPSARPAKIYASAESLIAMGARNIGEAIVPSAQAAIGPPIRAPRYSPAPLPRPSAKTAGTSTRPNMIVAGSPPEQGDGARELLAWAVQVGAYRYESQAAARLAAAQPSDARRINEADELITVARSGAAPIYRARFVGFSDERDARSACAELARHDIDCAVVPPGAW